VTAQGFGAQDKVDKSGDTMTGPLNSGSSITAGVVTLTYAATVTVPASAGNHFRLTLTGNATLGTPQNPADGQKMKVEIIQDGVGSRTLAYSGAYVFGTDIPQPVLSTGPGKRDFLGLIYNAVTGLWYLVACIHNF